MKKVLNLTATLLLIAGCTSVGMVKPYHAGPKANETIYIIGVSPDYVRVSVWPGSIIDHEFAQSGWRNANLYSAPVDGFVVGRAPAGRALAITNARFVASSSSLLGIDFKPCTHASVFTPKGGQVVYLGDLNFKYEGKHVAVKETYNYQAASQFLKSHYPYIKTQLTAGHFQHMPYGDCSDQTQKPNSNSTKS